MPNPYKGNAEAARYLARLGSKQDQAERTKRLYDKSIESRQAALKAVEREMYPPEKEAKRTPEQQQAYVDKMLAAGEQRRREECRKAEREMYQPHWRNSLDPVPEKEIVERMYALPVKRFGRSKAALKARETNCPPPKDPAMVERERKWKHVLHSPERKDRVLLEERHGLAREVEAIKTLNSARRPQSASGRREESPERRTKAEMAEYWSKLAVPFAVHPKVPVPKQGFTVYTKYAKASPGRQH
jgi:hypothetical protein